MPRFQANRRILALLAVFFFVTTLYFCTTRLSAMALIRQPLREAAAPAVRAAEGAGGHSPAQAALHELSRTEGEHLSYQGLEGADGRVEADKEQGGLEEEDFSGDDKDEAEEEDDEKDVKVQEEEEKEKEKHEKEEEEKEKEKEQHEKEEEKDKEDGHGGSKEQDEKEKDEEKPTEKEHEKAEEEDKESESEKTIPKDKQDKDEMEEHHKATDESQSAKDQDEEVDQKHSKHIEDQDPAHQTNAAKEDQQGHNKNDDDDEENGEDEGAQDVHPPGLRLHASLPEDLVPTASNARRLIIIGDIHGMLRPLRALLRKARFDPASDHIVSVGDMVSKGPSSGGVVALLMGYGASAVRGNHEDRVLLAVNASSSPPSSSPSSSSSSGSSTPSKEGKVGDKERKVGAKELETARALSEEQIAWLESLPAILSIEQLRMHVVHAGMLPGVRPEEQDPWAVMNMRTLTRPQHEVRDEGTKVDEEEEKGSTTKEEGKGSTKKEEGKGSTKKEERQRNTKKEEEKSSDTEEEAKSSLTEDKASRKEENESESESDIRGLVALDTRNGQKWTRAWNRYQRLLDHKRRWTVVYGHDARSGLRETRYAVGLDSGCVKGGALTGMVVEGVEGGRWRYKLVQVRCGEDDDDDEDDDDE